MTAPSAPSVVPAGGPRTGAPAGRPWLARLAFLLAAGSAALVLAFAGLAGIVMAAMLVVALAICLAAAWLFLSRHGPVRWLGLVLAVAAPAALLVIYARHRLIWVAVLAAVLWAVAIAAARAAIAVPAGSGSERAARPVRHPYLIMNPASGGGKVGRYRLAERARALGAEVTLLDTSGRSGVVDVTGLARDAVRRGVDLLGVAGGDGTQALVAAVAAEYRLPFLVISAGTRNHFALDLGLDCADPSRCLSALSDGVELPVDLGFVNDHPFVNNASFGAYAELVQDPAYRDGRTRAAIDQLPRLLTDHSGPRLAAHAAGHTVDGPQALLISNNPYQTGDLAGLGRRDRLDGGVLGVIAVRVNSALQAADLVRGARARGLARFTTDEVVVESAAPRIAVGIDGEAVWLEPPVRCVLRPGALCVRVPRDRLGARRRGAVPRWSALWRVARGA